MQYGGAKIGACDPYKPPAPIALVPAPTNLNQEHVMK